jgi:hypothetical protein
MFSFFKRQQDFSGIARANLDAYEDLIAQVENTVARVSEATRKAWLEVTVERIDAALKWRLSRPYDGNMDQAMAEAFRVESDRLLKQANKSGSKTGGDAFSRFAADSLASVYLMAESFCFEHPGRIDDILIIQDQKRILREINALLSEFDGTETMKGT